MAKLEISLFGPFQVLLNNSPVTQFKSVEARTLLAYLAAETVRLQRRESLAALLWPDRSHHLARKVYGYKHASNTP